MLNAFAKKHCCNILEQLNIRQHAWNQQLRWWNSVRLSRYYILLCIVWRRDVSLFIIENLAPGIKIHMSKVIRKHQRELSFFAHINFLVLIYCISFCFQKLISWFVAFSNSSQNSWIEKVYRLNRLISDGKATHLLNRIGLICCSSIRVSPFGVFDTKESVMICENINAFVKFRFQNFAVLIKK